MRPLIVACLSGVLFLVGCPKEGDDTAPAKDGATKSMDAAKDAAKDADAAAKVRADVTLHGKLGRDFHLQEELALQERLTQLGVTRVMSKPLDAADFAPPAADFGLEFC